MNALAVLSFFFFDLAGEVALDARGLGTGLHRTLIWWMVKRYVNKWQVNDVSPSLRCDHQTLESKAEARCSRVGSQAGSRIGRMQKPESDVKLRQSNHADELQMSCIA